MANVTTPTTALSAIEVFNICIYFIVFVLGIVGNGLVIFVTGYKMKTTVNSIWFLNLAIADFIFILVITLNIVTAFQHMEWYFGDFLCKLVSFVAVLNMFASIFLLSAISLDRCLSTWVIVWAQNKRTLAKARIICTFVWVLSIASSVPFVINRLELNNRCSYNLKAFKSLVLYRLTVGFLIPFLIIASSYIAIGVRAKRLRRGKKLKPFRVIAVVILAFFICWFPFHVQQLCTMIAMDNQSKELLNIVVKIGPFVNCLVYVNSCLNPILYVFMCEEFTSKLKQSILLVLETAFTEDHLASRSTLPSTCSESLGLRNDTTS